MVRCALNGYARKDHRSGNFALALWCLLLRVCDGIRDSARVASAGVGVDVCCAVRMLRHAQSSVDAVIFRDGGGICSVTYAPVYVSFHYRDSARGTWWVCHVAYVLVYTAMTELCRDCSGGWIVCRVAYAGTYRVVGLCRGDACGAGCLSYLRMQGHTRLPIVAKSGCVDGDVR